MKTLCIYHANCADGFGAAWVVRKALGAAHVDFHPGKYGEPAPDVEGRDVILVDFSYKRDQLLQLAQSARSILIIDHHKSAAEDLAEIPAAPANYSDWLAAQLPLGAVFDMQRSGAGLAWDYFNPGTPRPALIDFIEDRDLWKFRFACTDAVMSAVFSYSHEFVIWDHLINTDISVLIDEGSAICRKHNKDVAHLVENNARHLSIGGHIVPTLNCPHFMASDAGHRMARRYAFAACYSDTATGRVYSLRSSQGGIDVSEVAKLYGGGGHRNAAGFTVPFDHELVTGFLQAELITSQLAAMPEGYVVMPASLTAENGAKALLIGDFHFNTKLIIDGNEELLHCTVPWDTIKAIYAKAVAGLALQAGQEAQP